MRWRVLSAAVVCAGLAACASILGIDDGIPRDGSTGGEGGPDASLDVRDGSADAKNDGPFSPISCGSSTCNFAVGERCCRTGATTYSCVSSASACTGTFIPCDRPSQCPATEAGAETCCTTDVLNEAGTDYVAESVACAPSKNCLGTPTHYILCGDGDAAADCPNDAGCAPSTSTLPPFLICK